MRMMVLQPGNSLIPNVATLHSEWLSGPAKGKVRRTTRETAVRLKSLLKHKRSGLTERSSGKLRLRLMLTIECCTECSMLILDRQ